MEFGFSPEMMNWFAQLVAVLVYVGLGAIWFGPLFGDAWAREMDLEGLDEEAKKRQMPRGVLLTVVGGFLLAFALRFVTAAFTPAYWYPDGEQLSGVGAWMGGFWAWLGCFVPVQLGRVGWENRSWRLFGINTSFDFLALSAMALILGLWV